MTEEHGREAIVAGKVKYGKTAVVIFITVLIWVYADLALDEERPVHSARISVVKSNPAVWVTFGGASSVPIERIVLKGPLPRLNDLRRKLEKEGGLEFLFDAAREQVDESGSLRLLPFLQKDKEIKRLGLKVAECRPDKLFVTVEPLVEKDLEIRCVDEAGNQITADIKPEKIRMAVPTDAEYTAEVQLTAAETRQARMSPISKKPYVRLDDRQKITAEEAVDITIPQEDPRKDYYVTGTFDVALSQKLQGEYRVVVTNPEEVVHIAIRATPEAYRAFQAQSRPAMTLHIFDDDVNKGTQEQRRVLDYNFPLDAVRKGEIELKNPQQPAAARFKLVPLTAVETPAGAGE
ncbi:MAG: hypothetical protein ACYTEQ_10935 [Planctomycetota bacterium]